MDPHDPLVDDLSSLSTAALRAHIATLEAEMENKKVEENTIDAEALDEEGYEDARPDDAQHEVEGLLR